jgi:hypothetical protein
MSVGLIIGLKKSLLSLGLFVFLVMTAFPVDASHWCGQSTITVSPSNPVATKATTFTITVTNNGVDNTQLSAVQAKFSWEGTWKSAGSGTILAGQSKTFSVGATPPSAGTYQVDVKATGTSSGDVFGESSDCTTTATLTATQPSPGFDAAFVMVAIAAAGFVGVVQRQRRRGSA